MRNDMHFRRYREWRSRGLTATQALSYMRYQDRMRDMLSRFGEWHIGRAEYDGFAYADLDDAPNGYTVRVLIGDDDMPTDWGDLEPSEEERRNARPFYVAIQVLDSAGDEQYHDGIGGVDVIDLPGYLQRDWEDAAAYALIEYLYDAAIRWAENENRERSYWEARDVVTVG